MPPLRFPDVSEVFTPPPLKPLDPFLGNGGGKLYVRIIGANGSGKSALGRALRASDPDTFTFTGEDKKRLGTIFPNFGWGTVGWYSARGGGADRLEQRQHVAEALFRLAGTNLHILIEGMVVTNASERFWQIDLGMEHNFGRKVLLIYLDYSPEECLRRIYLRNGGKPIQEHKVLGNARGARNAVERYEARIGQGAPLVLCRESSLEVGNMVDSMITTMQSVYGASVFSSLNEDE
jgi:hypothetical protein